MAQVDLDARAMRTIIPARPIMLICLRERSRLMPFGLTDPISSEYVEW